jgi:hypothetical protein
MEIQDQDPIPQDHAPQDLTATLKFLTWQHLYETEKYALSLRSTLTNSTPDHSKYS